MNRVFLFAGLVLAETALRAPVVARAQTTAAEAEPIAAPAASLAVWGTGFFVDRAGHILTARHVVADCRQIAVANRTVRESATIAASSATDDLSLLRVAQPFGVPLAFDRREGLPGGTLITILGYGVLAALPSDQEQARRGAFANGIVLNDRLPRQIAMISDAKPGGSGSPVLDRDGLVVGVLARKVTRSGSILTGGVPHEIRIAVSSGAARDFLRAQEVPLLEGTMGEGTADTIATLASAEVMVACYR